MPTLGAALDFAKLEGRNFRAHQLGTAPASPVTGQMYYDTPSNTLMWYDGTTWQSAKGGVGSPPDASSSVKGVVQLAGDLSGTAAAPTVANNAITSAKIADGTITDNDVAVANKDGATGTYSMRSLGTGGLQALSGTTPLSSIAAPATSLNLNSKTIINLADPSGAQDGATKNYVDSVAAGLDAKQSCRLATTGNIALSGAQTIDGISTQTGDRILVKSQTDQTQNGIWLAASGAWTRATDMDSWAEVPGAFVFVEIGSANQDTAWICTSDQGGVLGTSFIVWVPFTSAVSITAGVGITKVGNQFSANVDNTTIDTAGAGSSIEIKLGGIASGHMGAGSVDLTGATVTGALPIGKGGTGQATVKAARETGLGAAGYYSNSATHGAGTTITITQATHGLRASRAILVQVQDNSTGNVELPDITVASSGDVTITYAASVSANSKLVTLIG